jgi:hypothetical protein
VKSREEIEKRLKKLRVRYARKHILGSQQRLHKNCVFNREHVPPSLPERRQGPDVHMVPRRQVTLVVLRDEAPIRLCMYGSEDASKWRGDVCDDDSVARSCKLFKASVGLEEAKQEFLDRLADDRFVFDNYRDVATLQWVLGVRVHEIPLSVWDRLSLWLSIFFFRRPKALPPSDFDGSDLWTESGDDPTQNP